jgi:hypothetical protein
MRTGSTWLVNLLQLISGARGCYGEWIGDVLKEVKLAGSRPTVIKSHGVVDLDWPQVPVQVPLLRIKRNPKDSLISRALYAKNIRTAEGMAMDDELAVLGVRQKS